MVAADHDLVMSQPNGDLRADHVPGHEDQIAPRLDTHNADSPVPRRLTGYLGAGCGPVPVAEQGAAG